MAVALAVAMTFFEHEMVAMTFSSMNWRRCNFIITENIHGGFGAKIRSFFMFRPGVGSGHLDPELALFFEFLTISLNSRYSYDQRSWCIRRRKIISSAS